MRDNPWPPTPDTSGNLYLDRVGPPRRLSVRAILAVVLAALAIVSVGLAIAVAVIGPALPKPRLVA